MKLFRTSDIAVVRECQSMFGFDAPSVALAKRFDKFVGKYASGQRCVWIVSLVKLAFLRFFLPCLVNKDEYILRVLFRTSSRVEPWIQWQRGVPAEGSRGKAPAGVASVCNEEGQWHSQALKSGWAQRVWGTEVPQRGPGTERWGRGRSSWKPDIYKQFASVKCLRSFVAESVLHLPYPLPPPKKKTSDLRESHDRTRPGQGGHVLLRRAYPLSQSSTVMIENMSTTKIVLLPSTNFSWHWAEHRLGPVLSRPKAKSL